MNDLNDLREPMIAICRRMNAAGLNVGSAGNLSVRIDQGFLVTPSGISYETMTPDHIVTMDFSGRYYGNYLPTSEWRFHHAILAARTDINVVLHSHALYCSILACCRLDIPPIHYMIAAAGGDVIKCSDYAPFGTPELSDLALAALGPRNACLLGNHGVIVLGKTIDGAFDLLQEVENLAHLYTVVRSIGGGAILDETQMAAVLERFKTYGKQTLDAEDMKRTERIVPPPRGGDTMG
jgi:L-fuculose-phosphate aldolase